MDKDVILVVEDYEAILFNLRLLLELQDYEVLTAKNGREALEVLNNSIKRPDLIISDILMPEMDGYDLLEKVSNNPKWNMIPFIFLSAKASPDEIRQGKLLGVDDYLTKPIDEELLLSLIKNKIHKVRQIGLNFKNRIEQEFNTEIKNVIKPFNQTFDNRPICLFIVEMDESLKPKITNKIMDKTAVDIEMGPMIIKLFQITWSLFNTEKSIISPVSVLLNLESINMNALMLFDKITDPLDKDKSKQLMTSIIAPEISYYDSLNLKNILTLLSSEIILNQLTDLESHYQAIQAIL